MLVGVLEHHAAEHAGVALERDRARPGADDDAARLREFALELARLHLVRAAAIDDRHGLGAEPLRLHRDVDRRHAAADDDDPPADGQRGQVLRLPEAGDIVDGVDDVFELVFLRQAELVGRRRGRSPGRRRHSRGAGPASFTSLPSATPYCTSMPPIDRMKAASLRREVVDRLVGGDAVFVQAAGLAARLEDRRLDAAMASACAQARPAGPAPTIATRLPVGAPRL